MSNAKVIIVILRIGLIKKILLYKMSYSPGPYNPSSKHEIKVGLNLFNYPTKSDKATEVDASNLAKKADLANLKSDVDELNIDKLKNILSGLDSFKSKVGKLDVDKLAPVPTDLEIIKWCSW